MTQQHLSAPESAQINVAEPLYGTAADRIRDLMREPSDLAAAVRVAHEMLTVYGATDYADPAAVAQAFGATREALRILLRALDAEPVTEFFLRSQKNPSDQRCPAAHPEDPIPCVGPVVVTVLDAENAGADGCELHAIRLLASIIGGRPVAKPDAPDGIALRIFQDAARTRPFAWREGK